MKQKIITFGFVVLGAFILCLPAFYNGYPITHSDSGTYIRSGYNGIVPIDRPISYGIFIKYTSFYYSLWLTIFFQGLLLSTSLFILIKELFKNKLNLNYYFIIVLLFLSIFTGIGWYVSQIMADIFTPILLISFICILIIEKLDTIKLIFLSFIYILASCCHLSNGLIAASAIVLLLMIKILFIKKSSILHFKRLMLLLFLSFSSYLTVIAINYSHDNGISYSKGSHVFLMAHVLTSGTMTDFLKENCDKVEYKNCKICNYKDSLETNLEYFLWDANGTLNKTGGWENTSDEYNFLLKKILTNPTYLIKNIIFSLNCGFKQLTLNDIGDGLWACGEGSPAGIEIEKYYYSDYNNFIHCKQSSNIVFFKVLKTLNSFQNYLLLFTSFIILMFLYLSKNKKLKFATYLVILQITINSFVTAGLNFPTSRFQARVSWLSVLILFFILVENKDNIKATFRVKRPNFSK